MDNNPWSWEFPRQRILHMIFSPAMTFLSSHGISGFILPFGIVTVFVVLFKKIYIINNKITARGFFILFLYAGMFFGVIIDQLRLMKIID